MTKGVRKLVRQFNVCFWECPKSAKFDDSKEFYNTGVKILLDKHNIKYLSTLSDEKAAVMERFNRALKTSI